MARPPAQLALPLSAPKRWGGRRDGAGRKPSVRPAVRHVSRADFRRPLPAHVTLRLRAGLPSLRSVPIVREIERSFSVGCERSGLPPRALLAPGQSRASHRRGGRSRRAQPRDDGHRRASRSGRESHRTADRARARRSLPRADAPDPVRGPPRAPLRAAECAPPRRGERARGRADHGPSTRSRLLRAVVRWLEIREPSRNRTHAGSGRRHGSGDTREDVAARDRLATSWAIGSRRRPRATLKSVGGHAGRQVYVDRQTGHPIPWQKVRWMMRDLRRAIRTG